ncbi:tRNA-(guanine-N1)-methyltransferase [Methanocella sp. CWC-04]|uniref:tRNA-(Guanine-N1)-methyltransferase n=1 Tax=Methanooceanicella nereidis TaxID=2052831 RepID=A0AAP2R9U2_9EURY|nr:Rieske (2Fe-2S) protein [Methanocella sp. CWC-04]MCD1293554.1 tRNA-(guanine-N1)-methyltransferase [Methanocella sp. CWC-04]
MEEGGLAESSVEAVFPKGMPVLLIKKAGKVYAISNRCAHMGCTLAGGEIDGFTLICPCHNWKYDIRTGEFLSAKEIRVHTYPLKISEGKIFIRIDGGG